MARSFPFLPFYSLIVYPQCKDDEFQCRNGQCIEASQQCDITPDCVDGSDEELCSKYDCFVLLSTSSFSFPSYSSSFSSSSSPFSFIASLSSYAPPSSSTASSSSYSCSSSSCITASLEHRTKKASSYHELTT